jgi:DNA-binding LytR/AlgR family response regulator
VVLHALAALAYTVLHVGGFVLLRKLVYAAMGDSYGAGPLLEEFPYELRKDLLTYGALVILFWLAGERQRRVREPAPPATFEIRDGARRTRVPVSDIVAVTSAGNYVEFRLADGRRPLMRATLASIEAALGAQGLIRVHRAWVIHPARVTALAPDGSGDWTVQLGDLAVPLSRRFPQALAALRTDAVPEAT